MRAKSAVVVCASSVFIGAFGPALAAGNGPGPRKDAPGDLTLIDTVVVIYAENRSFDNLYGSFPGANGVAKAPASTRIQRDRDTATLANRASIRFGLNVLLANGRPSLESSMDLKLFVAATAAEADGVLSCRAVKHQRAMIVFQTASRCTDSFQKDWTAPSHPVTVSVR